MFRLGIWSLLSSPHPATLLNPSLQVPVRCGDGETLRELGWAPLPERIHLLLVFSDWLLWAAYLGGNQSTAGAERWWAAASSLEGFLEKLAAVWGCSDRVQPPVSFLLLLLQRPHPQFAVGNLRLYPGQAPRVLLIRQGAQRPKGCVQGGGGQLGPAGGPRKPPPHPHPHTPFVLQAAPLRAEAARVLVCLAPVRGESSGDQDPHHLPVLAPGKAARLAAWPPR